MGALPRQWGRGQIRGGVAKVAWAWLRPWRRSEAKAKAVGVVAKTVGSLPRPWGCCQGRRGVAKDKTAWPMPWGGPRPRGRGQGLWGVVKAVGAKPRPKSRRG